jgi:hypothetical protein
MEVTWADIGDRVATDIVDTIKASVAAQVLRISCDGSSVSGQFLLIPEDGAFDNRN